MNEQHPALLPLHRRPKELLRLLGILLLIAAVISVTMDLAAWGNLPDMLLNFIITFAYTAGLWLVNGYAVEWLNSRADWTRQPARRFLFTLAASLVASMVVILVVNGTFHVLYLRQPVRMIFAARMWPQYAFPLIITGVVSLFLHSRSFLQHWREAAIRAERVEKENAVARLDSLRRQVDPHFLFNSLNALTSLVEEDPSRAVRFIRQLSQVYRYVLDSQEQEVVSVAEEMRFVESYLFLQRTRLGEGLSVELKLPPAAALETLLVPPLAVQLLLENALKHNATSQRDPLRITVELDAAARRLTVRNTLRYRRVPEGESTGLGLQNLQARYAFLTSELVVVVKTETEFIVTLPLLELE
ncbi:sensor histidine kinase [Hymenobacter sediminicola]|uniref:Histidine kinase n=1 Tax=Hymenobacter sediminicola TaxID=2761579 RepID=A0A7G7WAS3_9BACT|nr:histidine kinase [Hymenobacter sediminicola]QNH63466.1 histidine kinase [Hymenobacter sediminicola]